MVDCLYSEVSLNTVVNSWTLLESYYAAQAGYKLTIVFRSSQRLCVNLLLFQAVIAA